MLVGDTHNFGQRVERVSKKRVYKPRTLYWESMFLSKESKLRHMINDLFASSMTPSPFETFPNLTFNHNPFYTEGYVSYFAPPNNRKNLDTPFFEKADDVKNISWISSDYKYSTTVGEMLKNNYGDKYISIGCTLNTVTDKNNKVHENKNIQTLLDNYPYSSKTGNLIVTKDLDQNRKIWLSKLPSEVECDILGAASYYGDPKRIFDILMILDNVCIQK